MTMVLKFVRVAKILVLLLLPGMELRSQATDSFPLFDSDEVFNVELRTDFSAIQIDRSTTPEYHDGELIYKLHGEEIRLSVKVMARGNFRRDTAHCSFPPLFVNFKKDEVKNTVFENQDRIKLITPCQGDEDVVEEYLIYKLYNEVTDLSFRARLVKILYYDTGADKKIFEKYSFFLEDDDHLAERNGGTERDRFLTPFDLDRTAFRKMSMFQFMIGNKDWFVTSRQNIVLVQPDGPGAPFAVPYDFDLSSFVNAAYTKPKGVPDRYLASRRIFKGICFTADEFNEEFSFFREKRPVFEAMINENEILSKRSKKYLLDYIGYFYKIIDDEDLIKKEILSTCETKKSYNIPE